MIQYTDGALHIMHHSFSHKPPSEAKLSLEESLDGASLVCRESDLRFTKSEAWMGLTCLLPRES